MAVLYSVVYSGTLRAQPRSNNVRGLTVLRPERGIRLVRYQSFGQLQRMTLI